MWLLAGSRGFPLFIEEGLGLLFMFPLRPRVEADLPRLYFSYFTFALSFMFAYLVFAYLVFAYLVFAYLVFAYLIFAYLVFYWWKAGWLA